MIPLTAKDRVTHVDEDGVRWEFVSMYGEIEREFIGLSRGETGTDIYNQITKSDEFFDRVVTGWSDNKGRMPEFPKDGKPSRLFNQSEMGKVFSMWSKANRLTAEEKKVS